MLNLPSSARVFLHRAPIDFRKSHDGLVAIVRAELREDPLSGDLFVFMNRRRDRVKLLQWDGNGLWLHYKRLERGTFRPLEFANQKGAAITRSELTMLLEGIEMRNGRFLRRFADRLRIEARDGDGHTRQAHRGVGGPARAVAHP